VENSLDALIDNLQRIFWGESSLSLLLELVFRTSFLFLFALFLVRIIGKRGLSSIAPFEFAVIVVLGTVLGDPMLNLKVPLIHGMVVLTIIVSLQRLLVHLTENNLKVEGLLESQPRRLVSKGVIDVSGLHNEGFSHEDLFLSLREKEVEHLGEVKAAFLETSGKLSVWKFRKEDILPGLPINPSNDKDCPTQFPDGTLVEQTDHYSCAHCGATFHVKSGEKLGKCSNCKHGCWVVSSTQSQFHHHR